MSKNNLATLSQKSELKTCLTQTGETDYLLNGASVWIGVGGISVYLRRIDEGVAVDLFPLHEETEVPLASTYAYCYEGKDVSNPKDDTPNLSTNGKCITHVCGNCDKSFNDIPGLSQVHYLAERLTPGNEVPSGECPECGALCYRR